MDFTNKNVIITGGASGIGRAVAEGIVEGGGRAIIADINLESAQQVCAGLGNAAAYRVNLADPAEIRTVFTKIIADSGRIDVLINNAGIVSTGPFEDLTQEEWDKVIAIDLTAVYVCTSILYPHMAANGYGRIVNTSSVAAKRGGGLLGTSAYASAKAGVIGLTKAIAREGARKGITCNAVCPSVTLSPMIVSQGPERQALLENSVPMGRGAQPKEIANMILFLASDLASFVTGEISDVDGGVTMDG